MKELPEIVPEFLENRKNPWEFGNSILYNMCADHPEHRDGGVIAGKLWLIGRAYSAALERRKTGDGAGTDEFYHEIAAPRMLAAGPELDERIARLNSCAAIDDESLDLALNTHKFLADVLEEISGLEKRSLASKYLHFHCPKMFFIYDSRAKARIKQLVGKNQPRLYRHYPCGYDVDYADFCVRALDLKEYIAQEYGVELSPREIDNLLLYGE